MSFGSTVELLNKLVDGITKFMEWVQRKATTLRIRGAIKKSNESKSQEPLEELTGDSGLPTRRKYSNVRRRKKSGH